VQRRWVACNACCNACPPSSRTVTDDFREWLRIGEAKSVRVDFLVVVKLFFFSLFFAVVLPLLA
jgi:hypothetical protein